MLFKSLATLALAAGALAQRPENTSICDYYTTALLKNNTAENQLTLLTLLVNTAVIGNYSTINVGVAVPGILNPNGTQNGTAVNLVPYFSGALLSTNDGGSSGVSKNFLDGGGATPLMNNTAANSTSSNQYTLLTHLYQFFGVLLGCSQQGGDGSGAFPSYQGEVSMYEVHKFMVLDPNEMNYFITQVGLSAASFGVATSDIQAAAGALNQLFNYRCSPPVTGVAALNGTLQSTCTDPSCPLAPNSNCTGQEAIAAPQSANSSSGGSSSTMSGSMTMSGSATGTSGGAATTTASGGSASTSRPASAANTVQAAGALGFLGAAVALLL